MTPPSRPARFARTPCALLALAGAGAGLGCASDYRPSVVAYATDGRAFTAEGASAVQSDTSLRSAVAASAGRDLGCDGAIEIVASGHYEYLGTASTPWVADGCGRRASYTVTCDARDPRRREALTCRFVLLGRAGGATGER